MPGYKFVPTIPQGLPFQLLTTDGEPIATIPVDQATLGGGGGVASVTASGILASTGGANPNIAPIAGITAIVSVANTAALSAYAGTAVLLQGALALVQSRQSYWSYQPGDASAADGWHIPALGGGNWVYVTAADGQTQLNQTAWFIDMSNSSGVASDDNNGFTALTPLLTKAEWRRRIGPYDVVTLNVTTTITYMSGDTGTTDPGDFRVHSSGGSIIHVASLPAASFTGTLNVVTAKSVAAAPGNALQSTFNTTSGALVTGMLLVNSTRANSRAFTQKNTAGTWQLSQPMSPYAGTGTYSSVENNAWAAGDTITGYTLNPVNIDDATMTGFGVNDMVILYQANWGGPNSASALRDGMRLGGHGRGTLITESVLSAPLYYDGAFQSRSLETHVHGNVAGGTSRGQVAPVGDTQVHVIAGLWAYQPEQSEGTALKVTFGGYSLQWTFESDTIIAAGSATDHARLYGATFQGNTCIDEVSVFLGGPTLLKSGILYGAGTLDVTEGRFQYQQAASAASQLFCALTLQNQGIAYSYSTTGGVTTIHGNIALTAANLDAASGAAGFGGFAFGPGCCISNGQQP